MPSHDAASAYSAEFEKEVSMIHVETTPFCKMPGAIEDVVCGKSLSV